MHKYIKNIHKFHDACGPIDNQSYVKRKKESWEKKLDPRYIELKAKKKLEEQEKIKKFKEEKQKAKEEREKIAKENRLAKEFQREQQKIIDNLKNRKFKLLYLLGSDNLEFQKNDEFIVYQGSHGDRGAEIADLILPSATYTEQNGLYENLEGRIQECKKASYTIGEALEDWKVFNLILKALGKNQNLLKLLKQDFMKVWYII